MQVVRYGFLFKKDEWRKVLCVIYTSFPMEKIWNNHFNSWMFRVPGIIIPMYLCSALCSILPYNYTLNNQGFFIEFEYK